jgi:hypothetical protein
MVVELLQNDLDAGASRTIIDFKEHVLVCEGNDKPIDPARWRPVARMLGAGGEVAAKKDGIGSKNHGTLLAKSDLGGQSG